MLLKVKKLNENAVLPKRANEGDVGYDLVALDDGKWSDDKTYIEYDTGIAIEVPEGYHTELFPRSSISKTDLMLANGLGLVDGTYRNSIRFRFKYIPRLTRNDGMIFADITMIGYGKMTTPKLYKKGDRIGQIVIRKTESLDVVEVQELSTTVRNLGGFGSTGQ